MRFDQAAFGCRLKETRKERGLTQEQLAEALNISTPHLGNIEIGKRGTEGTPLFECLIEKRSSFFTAWTDRRCV